MESNISSCQTSQLGSVTNPMCQDPNRAAGIRCSLAAGFCIDGQTRLVDGPSFYEGRLEVCLGNQWLSVCDADFNSATADDVCNNRLLLFGGVYVTVKLDVIRVNVCINYVYCYIYSTDATPVYGAAYGQGTGPLLTACPPGSISSFINFVPLGNCTTMQPDLSCSHERDVGVQCSPGQGRLIFLFTNSATVYVGCRIIPHLQCLYCLSQSERVDMDILLLFSALPSSSRGKQLWFLVAGMATMVTQSWSFQEVEWSMSLSCKICTTRLHLIRHTFSETN